MVLVYISCSLALPPLSIMPIRRVITYVWTKPFLRCTKGWLSSRISSIALPQMPSGAKFIYLASTIVILDEFTA